MEVVFGNSRPMIGLPQGSVLSSIFFLLFINDLPQFSPVMSTILYADDTTLSLRNNSVNILIQNCNEQLTNFSDWSTANRLTINTDKTFYMIFTNRKLDPDIPPVTIASIPIHRKTSEKFLGVVVDERLKFGGHVGMLCAKVSRSVGVLYRLRDYLPLQTLISLYYSFIYPYLIYCNLIWGPTFQIHLKPLEILQKKAIRNINCAPYDSHTNELFLNNNLLKLKDINVFYQAIHVYKFHSNFSPLLHPYDTRNSSNLNSAFQRTVGTQRSLSYSAPSVWNRLPADVREAPSLAIFKRKLKAHLINQYSQQ